MPLNDEREAALRACVAKDLSPAALTVWTKSLVAVALGGGVSLLVCGQFGVEHAALAEQYNAWLHRTFGGQWCVVACATHFAVLPALFLRILAGGLQFRAVVKRHLHAPLGSLALAGISLSSVGGYAQGFLDLALWMAAALAAFSLSTQLIAVPWRRLAYSR